MQNDPQGPIFPSTEKAENTTGNNGQMKGARIVTAGLEI